MARIERQSENLRRAKTGGVFTSRQRIRRIDVADMNLMRQAVNCVNKGEFQGHPPWTVRLLGFQCDCRCGQHRRAGMADPTKAHDGPWDVEWDCQFRPDGFLNVLWDPTWGGWCVVEIYRAMDFTRLRLGAFSRQMEGTVEGGFRKG